MADPVYNLDLDTPEATVAHSEFIRQKAYLEKIYEEHYRFFSTHLAEVPAGEIIELGSGGGFIKEVIPHALTSDVIVLPDFDTVFSGTALPFQNQSLSALMMINVFHHIQDVSTFLSEAERCLVPGGKILMVEPANTPVSKFIYSRFHHEPFNPGQREWKLPSGGRMSVANDALPWIVFCRDREKFRKRHPKLRIEMVKNFLPFRYVVSGGFSRGQMLPSWTYGPMRTIEGVLSPLNNLLGLFMRIVLTRV